MNAADPPAADPRWSQYMLWRLPDLTVVFDETLRRCDCAPGTLDEARMLVAVNRSARQWLLDLTSDRAEFGSAELGGLLDAERFDVGAFTAYLSTKGALGVAVSNKLAAFLTGVLPATLAERVRDGEFDL